jgi:cyclophilin family peptidyl-prolyl cis-trans isomerase
VCPSAKETKRIVWFKAAPPNCIGATSVWDATFVTSAGTFTVRMDAAKSYKAVNNFVFLSRWNYYNGTLFHRIVTGFIDQGGDPTGSGTGAVAAKGKVPAHDLPGYQFTGNTPPASCNAKKDCYPVGSIALANSGSSPSTDGSQFFIIVSGNTTDLPPDYTLFGQVTTGMPVVDKINSYGTAGESGTPTAKVYLLKVVVKQVTS